MLKGPINQSTDRTNQLVFFLHGWGSDGNDLIQISQYWKQNLNNTTFLAPNGPEECTGNPSGKQWFNILTENTDELYKGLENSFLLLEKYINHQLQVYKLGKKDFFLVGFSQGTMLSLFTSVRIKCKGVIGYSGAFLSKQLPKDIVKNDILLIHGKLDNVVPLEKMENAEKILLSIGHNPETKIYEQLDHSINQEGLDLGLDFIKKRF